MPHSSDASNDTPISVVEINGYKFVSGLFWQPLSRPRAYMAEARKIGKEHQMDIVALRTGLRYQAGFVSKDKGVDKGMYSLASALAGILNDSFLGIFKVPADHDGTPRYALVAVAEGSIIPDNDIIADFDTILDVAIETTGLFGQKLQVYAPSEFGDLGVSREYDLNALITPENLDAEYKLKNLQVGLTPKQMSAIAAFVAVALGGLYAFNSWQEEIRHQELVEQARKQRELEEINAKSKVAQTPVALEHPWAKLPSISDFLQHCNFTFDALPLSVAGWHFAESACSQNGVESKYQNTSGTPVAYFRNEMLKVNMTPLFNPEGNAVSVSVPITLPAKGDEKLLSPGDAVASIMSLFQSYGLNPNLMLVPEPAPVALADGSLPPAPNWYTYHFSVVSNVSPKYIFANYPGIGVRLSSIKVQLSSESQLSYNIEGDMYANKQ